MKEERRKDRAVSESGDEDGDEMYDQIDLDAVNDSDTSESSIEMDRVIHRPKLSSNQNSTKKNDDMKDDDEDEDEEDIPVSDLEDLSDDDKEDLVPHTRLTINNTAALRSALDRIAIPTTKSSPFVIHQSVLSTVETAASIPDVSDDLQRELAFYTQSLEAVKIARTRLIGEGLPFSRPKDYFAEMVKEDAHMEKVKAKLVEEASNKKAAAEARKLRDLKKFGKQVQVAKLQERQKEKRETLEKIKTLKRKRQESNGKLDTKESELFDVGVDKELGSKRLHGARSAPGSNVKRQKKNDKYGFGGKKRHGKSGDAESSGDLSGFNARGMKAGAKNKKASRPGKGRRKAMSSR